jgi:transcription elongation factor Elf1
VHRREEWVKKTSPALTKDRARRIAQAHACEHCGEYTYKRLVVTPATPDQRQEFDELWHVSKTCGVCGQEHEMGIDAQGDILYVA